MGCPWIYSNTNLSLVFRALNSDISESFRIKRIINQSNLEMKFWNVVLNVQQKSFVLTWLPFLSVYRLLDQNPIEAGTHRWLGLRNGRHRRPFDCRKTCLRVLNGRLQYTGDFYAILAAILSANSNGLWKLVAVFVTMLRWCHGVCEHKLVRRPLAELVPKRFTKFA